MNDTTTLRSDRAILTPITLVEPRLTPYGVALFIGNADGAADLALLQANGITTVINCAANLDLNVVPGGADAASFHHGQGPIRYYKTGLIDGPGNPATMMLGAYYIVRGAMLQVMPERASYPNRTQGNVLINCRGGRSRSVVLAALLMHHAMPQAYPDLDEAIDCVRHKRGLLPQEWVKAPKPVMIAAARLASEWITKIGNDPVQVG